MATMLLPWRCLSAYLCRKCLVVQAYNL